MIKTNANSFFLHGGVNHIIVDCITDTADRPPTEDSKFSCWLVNNHKELLCMKLHTQYCFINLLKEEVEDSYCETKFWKYFLFSGRCWNVKITPQIYSVMLRILLIRPSCSPLITRIHLPRKMFPNDIPNFCLDNTENNANIFFFVYQDFLKILIVLIKSCFCFDAMILRFS